VLQLNGDAALSAMHCFPMMTPIQWSNFCTELKTKSIQSNALGLVKPEWEELCLKNGEHLTEFNQDFRGQRLKMDPHQPIPAEMVAEAYGYKIKIGNQVVYKDLVWYIGMYDRTPTLE